MTNSARTILITGAGSGLDCTALVRGGTVPVTSGVLLEENGLANRAVSELQLTALTVMTAKTARFSHAGNRPSSTTLRIRMTHSYAIQRAQS